MGVGFSGATSAGGPGTWAPTDTIVLLLCWTRKHLVPTTNRILTFNLNRGFHGQPQSGGFDTTTLAQLEYRIAWELGNDCIHSAESVTCYLLHSRKAGRWNPRGYVTPTRVDEPGLLQRESPQGNFSLRSLQAVTLGGLLPCPT